MSPYLIGPRPRTERALPAPRTEADEFRRRFALYMRAKKRLGRYTNAGLGRAVGLSQRAINQFLGAQILPTRESARKIGEYFDEPHRALVEAGYVPYPGWPVLCGAGAEKERQA